MRVLFDAQVFEAQAFGGVSRYYVELARELKRCGVGVSVPVQFAVSGMLREVDGLAPGLRIVSSMRRIPRLRRLRLIGRLLAPIADSRTRRNRGLIEAALSAADFDVFHPTYYDPYFLPSLTRPLVVTVFDMIHEIFPEYFDGDQGLSVRKRVLVERADRVITISETVKRQLLQLTGVPDERVVAIPLASAFASDDNPRPASVAAGRPYFLFVGNRSRYKNFAFFLRVFARAAARRPIDLVCTGPQLSPQERAYAGSLGLEGRVHHRYATESELSGLYAQALAFVFPSLAEGFGIPLLEAMSCGCPVAASDIEVFHEVAGDAALYFDPKSAASMAAAVERLADDRDLRLELASRGRRRVALFSWARTAAETRRVYESVL